ncbi:MAG: PorV/PorQ family protein [Elusimicrobia bacterium]|nr:PorV/PorQ family protein [Elusimicrobiota bacterium]
MRLSVKGALIFLLFVNPSYGGGTKGATPFNFLFLDPHPRPAALGGAYGSIAKNPHSLAYNPAGLSGLESNEISFMHNEHFEGITQDHLALGLKKRSLAFSLTTLSFGKIPRTTLSNPSGSGLGNFTIRDWVFSVGYAQGYKEGFLSLGVAGKYLQERIDAYQAETLALDLGALIDLEPKEDIPAAIGVSLQNLGPKVKFQSSQEELPTNLKTSLAYQPSKKSLIALDLNQPKGGDSTIHLGAGYRVSNTLSLRAGYNGRNDAAGGLTAGFGFAHVMQGRRAILLEYAFVPFGDLGVSHLFSLGYRW